MTVSPERVSRSHRGEAADTAPGRPAMSPVKSYCIRTPWLPVTIIAAYADPCPVLRLMMIPALDQGWTPRWLPVTAPGPPAPPAAFAGP